MWHLCLLSGSKVTKYETQIYSLSPHCNVLFGSYCELTQWDGFLRNSDRCPIVWTHIHLGGFIRNKIPGTREKRQQEPLEEVTQRPWIITQDLGKAGSSWGAAGPPFGPHLLCGAHLWGFITSRAEPFLSNTIHSFMLGTSQKFSSK